MLGDSSTITMIEAIVCDWNKTLFKDAHESEFFTGLIKKVAFSFPNYLNLRKLYQALEARRICREIYSKYLINRVVSRQEDRARFFGKIIEVLNNRVIEGTPSSLLKTYVEEYAIGALRRLDWDLLNCLATVHRKYSTPVLIISSGCATAIKRTLELAKFPFESVIANDFEMKDDKLISRFNWAIYGNKGLILQSILRQKGLSLDEVAFIGDDWEDRDCFRMAKFPIVSFYADENSRARLVEYLNVFAPRSAIELESFLLSNTNTVVRVS